MAGPVDPSNCIAAGVGIAGGAATSSAAAMAPAQAQNQSSKDSSGPVDPSNCIAAGAGMAGGAATSSAAAIAAAQAQNQSSSGSPDKAGKIDALKRTLQVSNFSPVITIELLKQLFGFMGTVIECTITDCEQVAYIEYSKPEEAAKTLRLNNINIGGQLLNIEMAKSPPPKPATG